MNISLRLPFHHSDIISAPSPRQSRKRLVIGISLVAISTLLVAGTLALSVANKHRASNQNAAVFSQPVSNSTLKLPAFLNTTLSYVAPASLTKYVATDGSDNANGDTITTPYKTVCKALANTASGGTIILRGGVYREGYDGTNGSCNGYRLDKKIAIQSYQSERAWLKGSLVVTNWQAVNGHWKVNWPQLSNLASSVPVENSAAVSSTNPMGGDAAMIYINGVSMTQVANQSAVTIGSFYADRSTNTLYLGTNPAGNTVEVTAYPRSLYFNTNSTGSSVKGVGFAQFGTSWNQSTTPGAVIMLASSITLDNTVFSQNAAWGVLMGGPKQTLRNSVLSNNGHDGVLGNRMDGSVLENNIFDNNNTERLGVDNCGMSCTAAGVKVAHADGLTVRNNTFSNNKGYGFWCDLTCQNVVFVNNNSHDNARAGIFYEVSSVAMIASNLIYNNATSGIRISGSDHVRIYNNTLVNNGTSPNALESAIGIYDDARTADAYGLSKGIKWDTSNVEIVNNVMAYNGASPFLDIRRSTQIAAENMISKFSSNAYYRTNGAQPQTLIRRLGTVSGNYSTLAAAIQAKVETTGSISNDTGASLFEGDSYNISSASAAYRKAETIPNDILNAIGNPIGPYSLGYLGASQLIVPGPSVPPIPTPTPPPTPSAKDTTAPQVRITSPTPSQKMAGIFSLQATASDNVGVSKVEFYVNGFLIGADTTAPYAVSWGSTLAMDGTYPVTAVAYDVAGNKASAAAVTVISENVVPVSVKITSPTANQVVGGGTFKLEAAVTTQAKISKVEFFVNGFSIGAHTTAPYWVYWGNTGVANGNYPVMAKVFMVDGRVISSAPVTVVLKK